MKRVLAGMVLMASLFATHSALAAARPATISQELCTNSNFTCIKISKGDTWEKLFPDDNLQRVVMNLNRMNTRLHPGLIIAVPNNFSGISLMDISPFVSKIESNGNKVIIYDPAVYAWGAYDRDGHLVKWGPASSGKAFCPDINSRCRTPSGTFAVYRKGSEHCKSTKFPVGEGGAPMPFCMFFKGGYALHASPEVPGYHASHGCVRMFYDDARWLNQEFVDLPNASNNYKGTIVIVKPYPLNG